MLWDSGVKMWIKFYYNVLSGRHYCVTVLKAAYENMLEYLTGATQDLDSGYMKTANLKEAF